MANRLLLLVLCIFMYGTLSAEHFTGGHLRYEYIGSPFIYKIQLTLYNACDQNAIGYPTFTNVLVQSKQNNIVIDKNLPLITKDTVQQYCSGTTSSCSNISSQYPGMTYAVYEDTVKLPMSAPDWNFVFANSTRSLNIVNLQSASSQTFYIDAPINTNSQNSSAVLPDFPPMIIPVNDSVVIPLSAVDADGDDIGYAFETPKSGQGMNIPYYTGFSNAAPFGQNGLCYIDSDNNMVLKSSTSGKYTLCLRVTEYRNGNPVAYTLRDFVVVCIPVSGGSLSIPKPLNTNNLTTVTCPGRSNLIALNFKDPASTDNVNITIDTPDLAGNWNFQTTTNNGTGGATGKIEWTTPTSINPATLPYFNVIVSVEDDACLLKGKATYIYKVELEDCRADSVWPGDANSDKVVNLQDPLAVAMAYGDTGRVRPNASNNWVAQVCDFWNGSFLNNIDKKHADCNGDGIVDTLDLNVIKQNYGRTRPKGTGPRHKTTAQAELRFNHLGVNRHPGDTATVRILLGSATAYVNDLYGLATNVSVSGLALTNPPELTYPISWLGSANNTLSFTQELSSTSVDWVYARTDKQNQTGQGLIADISFVIPGTTPPGTLVRLSFNNTTLMDKDGVEITDFSTLEDTFYVWYPDNITDVNNNINSAYIYPNPSKDRTTLAVDASREDELLITISDVTGKQVSKESLHINAGSNEIPLHLKCSPGMYMIHLQTKSNSFIKNLKWIKQQ